MDELDNVVSLRLITHNMRLVKARKEKGFIQPEMAKLVGLSMSRLYEIETLKRLPSFDEMDRLANGLSQDIEYLFPKTLLNAIQEGVFDSRYRELDEVEIITLAEAEREQLSYDGESLMIGDIDRKMLREEVLSVLDSLYDQQARRVIILRFGFDGGPARTLEEVAAIFHLTRQRISQIEAKALRLLRHHTRARRLRPYLY